MQENNQIIKSILEQPCPNCGQKLFIETQTIPATTSAVFTMSEMMDAKQDCVKRIETLTLDEEKKKQVLAWVNNENTIFSGAEVDGIIESLLKPEII